MTNYIVNPGDTIQLGTPPRASNPSITPSDISAFLEGRGWIEHGPFDDVWKHDGKVRFDMTWEQAMACEFYEFITLGGK